MPKSYEKLSDDEIEYDGSGPSKTEIALYTVFGAVMLTAVCLSVGALAGALKTDATFAARQAAGRSVYDKTPARIALEVGDNSYTTEFEVRRH